MEYNLLSHTRLCCENRSKLPLELRMSPPAPLQIFSIGAATRAGEAKPQPRAAMRPEPQADTRGGSAGGVPVRPLPAAGQG